MSITKAKESTLAAIKRMNVVFTQSIQLTRGFPMFLHSYNKITRDHKRSRQSHGMVVRYFIALGDMFTNGHTMHISSSWKGVG